jgi:hypothetical protein
MKKIIMSVSLFGLLFSCQKDKNTNNTSDNCNPPVSTFKYKFNGTTIECNGSLAQTSKEGSLIRKEQVTGTGNTNPIDNQNGDPLNNTNYIFSILATKNYYYSDDGEPLIEIEIRTPSISETTYTHTTNGIRYVQTYYPSQSTFCGYCSPSAFLGQEFTVTISKFANGYADGTFFGKVKKSTTGFDIITEGEFKNVKVIQ